MNLKFVLLVSIRRKYGHGNRIEMQYGLFRPTPAGNLDIDKRKASEVCMRMSKNIN